MIHVGDRFMRYYMPVNLKKATRGAPPKPSRRMRSQSLAEPKIIPEKTDRSFSITVSITYILHLVYSTFGLITLKRYKCTVQCNI